MTSSKVRPSSALSSILPAAVIVMLQAFAGLFFVADALADQAGPGSGGFENLMESAVAVALLAGTVLGAVYLFRLVTELRLRATAVAMARGAMSKIIRERFAEWRLSAAEADVALFALKGCTIGEIASLRSSAPGTVRAQLSQVYAKAGVTSQPMLMSLFLDEIISGEMSNPATDSASV